MKTKETKSFLDEDFNSSSEHYGPFGYSVGKKFDEAGLPNPYIEDNGQVDVDGDERDGRGLPANFALTKAKLGETASLLVLTDTEKPLYFDENNCE